MPNLDHGTVILPRTHKHEIYLSFLFPCLYLRGLHRHLQPQCLKTSFVHGTVQDTDENEGVNQSAILASWCPYDPGVSEMSF